MAALLLRLFPALATSVVGKKFSVPRAFEAELLIFDAMRDEE
jgi:hypothetical protein